MKRRILASLSIVALFALAIGGMTPHAAVAGNGTSSPSPAAPSLIYLPLIQTAGAAAATTTYDVTYTDNTAVIDSATVTNDLISVSDDQSLFRFKAGASKVEQLQPGQVVIFSGKALRKVVAVSQDGGDILVTTERATLDKAIKDGTVAWSYPVSWMNLPKASYAAMLSQVEGSTLRMTSATGFGDDGLPRAAGRSDGALHPADLPEVTWEGTVEGWDVVLKLQLTPERLNIDLSGDRTVGGAKVAVSGKGWIGAFTQETFLTYEQSTPTKMTVKSTGLQSEMELKWAAVTPSSETLTEILSFSIPAEIPIPFTVGPIPVMLKVKAVLQVVPELRVDQASSGGSFKTTYRSDQGFAIENNVPGATGQIHTSDLSVSGPTSSAGFGPVGFGLGIEFPRLELAVFGATQAFITVKTYSYSIFTTEPPCQMGGTTLLSKAGYNLNLLGFSLASGTEDLWEQKFVKYKDDKQC